MLNVLLCGLIMVHEKFYGFISVIVYTHKISTYYDNDNIYILKKKNKRWIIKFLSFYHFIVRHQGLVLCGFDSCSGKNVSLQILNLFRVCMDVMVPWYS